MILKKNLTNNKVPNKETMASLNEVLDDLNDSHLLKTSDKNELEKLLNK